jgi:hypothetical protein
MKFSAALRLCGTARELLERFEGEGDVGVEVAHGKL